MKKKKKWDIENEKDLPTFVPVPGLSRFGISKEGTVWSEVDKCYCETYEFVDGLSVKLRDSLGNKGEYYIYNLLRWTYGKEA